MKVWILGARGQVGSALIDLCHRTHFPFVASSSQEADITDLDNLLRLADKHQCTHLINCGAYTDVDGAESNISRAYEVNATGPENLGHLARCFPIKIVHLSSDYVFDGEKGSPYVETDAPNPLGIYGKSKWEGEKRLLDLYPSACIVRTSWVFGGLQKNFISSVLTLLKGKEQLKVVSDQINRPTFNKDLAQALLDLSCHSGIFHFANHGALSRFQIVKDFYQEAVNRGMPLLCKEIAPISYAALPTASPRPANSVLDTTKIEGVLGRKPRMWETVLREYFDYVKRTL